MFWFLTIQKLNLKIKTCSSVLWKHGNSSTSRVPYVKMGTIFLKKTLSFKIGASLLPCYFICKKMKYCSIYCKKLNLSSKYIKLEKLKWFESNDSMDQIQIDPFSTFGNNLCMTLLCHCRCYFGPKVLSLGQSWYGTTSLQTNVRDAWAQEKSLKLIKTYRYRSNMKYICRLLL